MDNSPKLLPPPKPDSPEAALQQREQSEEDPTDLAMRVIKRAALDADVIMEELVPNHVCELDDENKALELRASPLALILAWGRHKGRGPSLDSLRVDLAAWPAWAEEVRRLDLEGRI